MTASNKIKIKKLKQYIALRLEYDCLTNSYQKLLHKLTYPAPNIQILSDMPMNRTASNTIQENYIKLESLLHKLNQQQREMMEQWDIITGAIKGLEDSNERTVMILRYLDGLAWEKICIKINYQWTQTHHLHSKALKNINI